MLFPLLIRCTLVYFSLCPSLGQNASRRGSMKVTAGEIAPLLPFPIIIIVVCSFVCLFVAVSRALAHNFTLASIGRFSVYTCAACNKGFSGFMKHGLKCTGKWIDALKLQNQEGGVGLGLWRMKGGATLGGWGCR